MRKLPEVILFDLGGVLVDWDGIEPLKKLSEGRLTTEMARRFWLESPWVNKFETGRCRPHEFAVGVIEELNLSLEPDEFLEQFVSWDRGLLPGALELLKGLRSRFLLVCLSNNNELHWTPLRDMAGLDQMFDYCFISHEIGVMKPNEEAFLYVLKKIGKEAEEILFFDDNQECIETASRLGLSAFCVSGVAGMESVLQNLGMK
ncbi:MAG: HAD family phosphatase [Deltaproteobacteria bacterium]|nr:HAD family phosphatase [Deltaproteobacteria bacterium]